MGTSTLVWNGNLVEGSSNIASFLQRLPSSETRVETVDVQPVSMHSSSLLLQLFDYSIRQLLICKLIYFPSFPPCRQQRSAVARVGWRHREVRGPRGHSLPPALLSRAGRHSLADRRRPVPHRRRESRRRRRNKLKLLRFSAFPLKSSIQFHDLPGLMVSFAFFHCPRFQFLKAFLTSTMGVYYNGLFFHCSIKAFKTFFS